MIKINLASGQRPFQKPWVNVDIREQYDSNGEKYPIDIVTDIKNLSMFEDASVDVLVGHHVWEHIPLHEQEQYLHEWWRVLKPGGKLLLCVPDMREIARKWVNSEIDSFTFAVNASGAWQGYVEDLHRWQYDERELIDRVSSWTGSEKKFPWLARRVFSQYDLDWGLYNGSDIAFAWWILIVEFSK